MISKVHIGAELYVHSTMCQEMATWQQEGSKSILDCTVLSTLLD